MGKLKITSIIFLLIGLILVGNMLINPSFILSGFLWLFLFVLIAIFVYSIWAIIDIAKASKPGNWKIMWILIVLLLNIIGAVLYFLIGAKQKEEEEWEEKLAREMASVKRRKMA